MEFTAFHVMPTSLDPCIILVSFANACDISNYSSPNIRFFNSSIENHTKTSGLALGIGTGTGELQKSVFPILYGEFFFSLNHSFLMSVRFMSLQEFVMNFGGGYTDTGSIKEFGILAGFYRNMNGGYLSASGGLGIVSGNFKLRQGGDPWNNIEWGDPFSRAWHDTGIIYSIPLEIQLFIRPFKTFGFGVIGFASVNTNYSYSGFLIGVNLFNQ